jgi:hypothetical protein
LCREIQLTQQRTAVHSGHASFRVHTRPTHPGKIDDNTTVTGRKASDAVTAGADCNDQVMLPREPDRRDDVLGIGAAGDECRMAIDDAIPDHARIVVPRVRGFDDLTMKRIAERADRDPV